MSNAIALWTGEQLPSSSELSQIEGARFHLIHGYQPERDGYHWLKGVALAHYEGRWIASFGHNPDKYEENNRTEVSNCRMSVDNGQTWGPLLNIDSPSGDLATSHGVFLIHDGTLWAFMGAFYGRGRPGGRVHTRAYVADVESYRQGNPTWTRKGVVAWDGFWPTQEPILMGNGLYIVAGNCYGRRKGGKLVTRSTGAVDPAVALVDADDLTAWDVIEIASPTAILGESAVMVDGPKVFLMARSNENLLKALVATSNDYGQTWSGLQESNLPMATSKPYAGTLSTGRHYLVNTISSDVGQMFRNPLTIMISERGEMSFRKAYRIIDSRWPLPGAEEYTHWAYPYAAERDQHLWVGFYMGTEGRNRSGAAGVVVIPLESLE